MSSEIWDVILLGEQNSGFFLSTMYEQLYTMKMSAATTFYDIVKNNIKWINSESIENIAWSTDGGINMKNISINDRTTRLIDVCVDEKSITKICGNKIYIKLFYKTSDIGKQIIGPIIGIPIYTFTTTPDGHWFKIKHNQNKTYSFIKIVEKPGEKRPREPTWMDSEGKWFSYALEFYNDGIFKIGTEKEFIIKTNNDKYVIYTKKGELLVGIRTGSHGLPNLTYNYLIHTTKFIPKEKVDVIDYENAKFGLIGATPFLHSFSNKGRIVANEKYYSPNKKYYAIFVSSYGLYVKDASNNTMISIELKGSSSIEIYNTSFLNYILFDRAREIGKAKKIPLSDGAGKNFILAVTDLGELICIDLATGIIEIDFGKKIDLNKAFDLTPSNQTSDNIGIDFTKSSSDKEKLWNSLEPILDEYNYQTTGEKPTEKQLPKPPISCPLFLPKNNDGKYLAFHASDREPKITDKRNEASPLYILPTQKEKSKWANTGRTSVSGNPISIMVPGQYDIKRVNHGGEIVYGTINEDVIISQDKIQGYHKTYPSTSDEIKTHIPKWECLDWLH